MSDVAEKSHREQELEQHLHATQTSLLQAKATGFDALVRLEQSNQALGNVENLLVRLSDIVGVPRMDNGGINLQALLNAVQAKFATP